VVFHDAGGRDGIAKIVVWKDAFDANRRLVMSSSFLVVHGQVQSAEGVIHVVAERFTDLSYKLSRMRDEELPPAIRRRKSATASTGGLIAAGISTEIASALTAPAPRRMLRARPAATPAGAT
jgi:DNA polymerase III alpha subunit